MRCLRSFFIASLSHRFVLGFSIVAGTLVAQQSFAQDSMMRGGDRMDGMRGSGVAIGIGAGLLIDQLSRQPQNDSSQNPKKPKQDKKATKTPPKTPEKPPIKQTKAPPEKPPVNPPPGTPPTTAESPPHTPGSPDSPGVPPTQTVSTPPEQPKTPSSPPEEPHDVPGQPKIYGHDSEPNCPQRGMGCAALIIDFNTHYFGDLAPLKDHLSTNQACEVEYVLVNILSGKGLDDANKKLNASLKNDEPEKNANNVEWQRLNDAIARHRERVAKGAELAIEIIRGEGYPAELRSCGSVGPAQGRSLDRQEFHAGNYRAANKNVCGWVVADYSCHSGYTPQVFDELNNRGGLPKGEVKTVAADGTPGTAIVDRACQPAQVNNCANHAAYEFDVAVGQSRSSLPACALFTPSLRDSLKGAFSVKGKSVTFDQSWSNSLYGSHYSDRGYRYCDPVVRDGYTSEPRQRDNSIAPVSASTTTDKPK